jgi:hypothetical protein
MGSLATFEFFGGPLDGAMEHFPSGIHYAATTWMALDGGFRAFQQEQLYVVREENGVVVRLPNGCLAMDYVPNGRQGLELEIYDE